jgi:hypothetical protein
MSQAIEMSPSTTRALRIAGWSLAAGLLALPAVAMQFTDEVDWSGSDFLFAGLMFGTVGALLELAARASASLAYRVGSAMAVGTGLLTIWITLAVGIAGSEDNPQNILYFGIVGMAICVAVAALGDPRSLARGMRATAAFQGLVCLIHVIDGVYPAVLIDGFFTMTWLTAGALFSRARKERETAAGATQS